MYNCALQPSYKFAIRRDASAMHGSRLNELVKIFRKATDSYERSPAFERRLKRDRKCELVEVHSLLVSFPGVLAATKILL